MEVEAQWAHAPQFAEPAEALYVRTDQIMAALSVEGGNRIDALYTPCGDKRVFGVSLMYDAEGILRAVTEPEEIPGLWEKLENEMEEINDR